MPKRGRKFITEFLIPNLNSENFGDKLAWVNRTNLVFQIQWSHKSASVWTENDCQVFVGWDKKQGHYRPMDKDYFPKSKQRFRAVLNKLIKDKEITQFKSSGKNSKVYCLGDGHNIPDELRKHFTVDENLRMEYFNENLIDTSVCISFDSGTCLNEPDLARSDALKDLNYLNNEDIDSKVSVSFEFENLFPISEKPKDNHSFNQLTNILEETEDLNHIESQWKL